MTKLIFYNVNVPVYDENKHILILILILGLVVMVFWSEFFVDIDPKRKENFAVS